MVLDIKREQGLISATINRPEKHNALNGEVFDALEEMVDKISHDSQARCLILTGAGEKSFCVGADLSERKGMTEQDILKRFEKVHRLYLKLENLQVPVIAAMNGHALGGGLELAMACDLRVVSKTAQVGLPETSLAIIPGNGGTQRLARIVGIAKAMELVFLAKRLNGEEAEHYGIVHRSVADDEVMQVAREWAGALLLNGPMALRQAKLAIRRGIEMSLGESLKFETDCYKPLFASKDRLEGLAAFAEKRKPKYTGE